MGWPPHSIHLLPCSASEPNISTQPAQPATPHVASPPPHLLLALLNASALLVVPAHLAGVGAKVESAVAEAEGDAADCAVGLYVVVGDAVGLLEAEGDAVDCAVGLYVVVGDAVGLLEEEGDAVAAASQKSGLHDITVMLRPCSETVELR
jgi:hypothetical protein